MKKILIFALRITLTFLLLLFLNSCTCKCIKTHLTNEEREWFNAYRKGQQIIFKSNLGNIDTLSVSNKYEAFGNKDCNCYEVGNIQNNVMNIDLQSKICHNDSYCAGGISIIKEKMDEKCFPSFSLFGLFYSKIHQKVEPKTESIKLITANIVYNYVYHIQDGVNGDNFGNCYLKSFYWDKKEGLIRYDTSEGEIFALLSKK